MLYANVVPLSDNKLSLKLANNSQIVATSAASDAGRSYAVSLLVVDEAAFVIAGFQQIAEGIAAAAAGFTGRREHHGVCCRCRLNCMEGNRPANQEPVVVGLRDA